MLRWGIVGDEVSRITGWGQRSGRACASVRVAMVAMKIER